MCTINLYSHLLPSQKLNKFVFEFTVLCVSPLKLFNLVNRKLSTNVVPLEDTLLPSFLISYV